ncbi:MAG: T9SS type A sorting domain-containing protein [Bacteroidetes bacterium]|nr:T9SS type A sorting domain-containing protein [Bacteroidota bacterium]
MQIRFIQFIILVSVFAPLKAQNWTLIDTSETHTSMALRDVVFTNDSTGYVVGGDGLGDGVILRTTDHGNTWCLTNVTKNLRSVYFPSPNIGYAVGESRTILKTTDAGNTWNYQVVNVVSSMYTAQTVVFLNNDTGFVSLINGPGYAFLKTYDGGVNWINDISDTVHGRFFSRINDSTVYGMHAQFSKTENNGVSWTNNNVIVDINSCEGMCFLNSTNGFATINKAGVAPCSNNSSLIETSDAGQTWIEKKYDCGALYSINFPSTTIGYMLGTPEINGVRKLWKTIDGGTNWLLSEYEVGLDYYSTSCYGLKLLCTDTSTCYIITNYGTILKTINGGGNNWMVGFGNSIENNIDFKLYPNPAQSIINIEFENSISESYTLNIVNVLGETVYFKQLNDPKLQVSVDEFSSGIYVVQVQSNKGILSTKFIKQ